MFDTWKSQRKRKKDLQLNLFQPSYVHIHACTKNKLIVESLSSHMKKSEEKERERGGWEHWRWTSKLWESGWIFFYYCYYYYYYSTRFFAAKVIVRKHTHTRDSWIITEGNSSFWDSFQYFQYVPHHPSWMTIFTYQVVKRKLAAGSPFNFNSMQWLYVAVVIFDHSDNYWMFWIGRKNHHFDVFQHRNCCYCSCSFEWFWKIIEMFFFFFMNAGRWVKDRCRLLRPVHRTVRWITTKGSVLIVTHRVIHHRHRPPPPLETSPTACVDAKYINAISKAAKKSTPKAPTWRPTKEPTQVGRYWPSVKLHFSLISINQVSKF